MKASSIQTDSSLVTGGKSDPFLPQLLDAINEATEIDITVAFIRQSGLSLIFDALRDAIERNALIRVYWLRVHAPGMRFQCGGSCARVGRWRSVFPVLTQSLWRTIFHGLASMLRLCILLQNYHVTLH